MAISRAQLVKELEPGLNALFGLEYNTYDQEHKEIYSVESSDRAFEEEVMLSGFAEAPTKAEGAGVAYDQAQEVYTARYTNETVALAFSLTEEAIEDNLYDKLSARYTKALARSMATTKQIKGAAILNGAFTTSLGGDGVALCATDHPTLTGPDLRNELAVAADLTEASLEQALIDIASFTDERGLKIAVQGTKLILPKELQFTADRILKSTLRVGTADNDINAVRNMGMVPQGYAVNHYLTDPDAWFIITDAPNGMKNTGNMRYKARERYSFGFSDPRGIFGSPGTP
jgi:hypothetical protein